LPDLRLLAGAGVAAVAIVALVIWLVSGRSPPPPPRPVPPPPHAAAAPAVPHPPPPPPPSPPISENGSSGPGGPTTVTIPPQLLHPAGGTPATLPPAPPKAAVPPPPKPRHEHRVVATARSGPKLPPRPDMQPLDRSHPDYPERYEDSDKTGTVTVTCIVQTNGNTSGCKIIHQEGGDAFGEAVLHWLAQDTTRFPPLLKHGHPAAQPFTWTIEFFP